MTPEELAAIERKAKWFAGGNIKAQDLIDLVDNDIPRLFAHIKELEEQAEALGECAKAENEENEKLVDLLDQRGIPWWHTKEEGGIR